MAIGSREIKSISGGSQKGRSLLDAFNPTSLGVGSATPVTTQSALTAADASTVDGTYGAEEQAVIGNNRTRIGEIEAALQAFGILT
jgi:hypothetical protein